MMKTEATRRILADPVECPEPGKKLIELQVEGWDVLGVSRDVGCQALDNIQMSDSELFRMRQEFCQIATRMFVQTIEDRKPSQLESKAKIPREKIALFFDTCNAKLDLPETLEMLVSWAKENKAGPNQLIIDMQKDMLECVGWEREHGCMVLSSIPQDFPGDKDLMQRLMQWKGKAEQICMMVVKIVNQHMRMEAKNCPGEVSEQIGRAVPVTEVIEQQLNASNDMRELAAKARKEIATMSEEAQEEHVTVMQEKMEKIMKLPPAEKQEAMRNNEVDKYDVVKSHVIMAARMEAKKATPMQVAEKPCEGTNAGGSAVASSPAPKLAVPTTAAPGQMTM